MLGGSFRLFHKVKMSSRHLNVLFCDFSFVAASLLWIFSLHYHNFVSFWLHGFVRLVRTSYRLGSCGRRVSGDCDYFVSFWLRAPCTHVVSTDFFCGRRVPGDYNYFASFWLRAPCAHVVSTSLWFGRLPTGSIRFFFLF